MSSVTLQMLSAYVISQLPFRRRTDELPSPGASLLSELARTAVFALLAGLFLLPSEPGAFPIWASAVALRLLMGYIGSRFPWRSWEGLLIWEAVQLAAVALLCAAFVAGLPAAVAEVLGWRPLHAALVAYALSLGLGSALVPLVTARLQSTAAGEDEGLKGAGTCIGILERLLVTSMILFWPHLDAAAIGLVFSAKSIARFPQFGKAHFAEYFLVGSLTSFIVAIGAGLIARSLY